MDFQTAKKNFSRLKSKFGATSSEPGALLSAMKTYKPKPRVKKSEEISEPKKEKITEKKNPSLELKETKNKINTKKLTPKQKIGIKGLV